VDGGCEDGRCALGDRAGEEGDESYVSVAGGHGAWMAGSEDCAGGVIGGAALGNVRIFLFFVIKIFQ
jgi:hypothetical protein